MKLNLYRTAALVSSLAGFLGLAQDALAGTPVFTYVNRDMMLCFRKIGGLDGSGSINPNDLEVDIGQASLYYNATPGSTINITQFTPAQLTNDYDSLNDLNWSVGGHTELQDGGDPAKPVNTLWVTAPRVDPSTPAPAWVEYSASAQGTTGKSHMDSILFGANFYSGTVPASTNNTATVVFVPAGDSHDYDTYMGPQGNYGGTFAPGDVEFQTPSDFTAAPSVARSDLYELPPDTTGGTHPAGKYLGYFELSSVTGTMKFVAASASAPPPPAPTLSVTASNQVNTISFASTLGATYTLYYTNSAGLKTPTTNWPSAGTNITGNGSTQSFQDPQTGANRFYRVTAQ